jgi:chromosome transmission fidelity protein 1
VLIDDLGRALLNLGKVIPDGIVCFFPSYSYLESVLARWATTGTLAELDNKKKLFREPRDSENVAAALGQYRTFIETTFPGSHSAGSATGAMLLCVVGGKMSEGINFADGLGRCVVVVGMPFANANDPVLKEKLRHSGSGDTSLLEDLCFKAVNQSIGRAIRHANDYAVVVLADRRYARPSTRDKLPRWMVDRLPTPAPNTFAATFSATAKFFAAKKVLQAATEAARRAKVI